MKLITFFAFTFLAFHFTYGQTDKETQKIIKEILTITKKYNHTWEILNMDSAAKFHSDRSFRYYRYGKLSVGSNEEFKIRFPQFMQEIKSMKTIEFSNPVVQVLSKSTAVIGFKGLIKIFLKNGKEELDGGTVTYVWQKVNNEWKIVHIHESTK